MSLDTVLCRLSRVRQVRDGAYRASCPTGFHHRGDHSASLCITEAGDGKILLYCPAGCTTPDVLDALALDWSDLFADKRERPKHNYRKILKCVAAESTVVAIAARRIARGECLPRGDLKRLESAANRLRGAAEVACQK